MLQQPLAAALEPFRRLQRQLALDLALRRADLDRRQRADRARHRAAGARARDVRATDGRRRLFDGAADAAQRTRSAISPPRFARCRKGIASREQRITDLAYRDTLTGLPNRTLFAERLDQALAGRARERTPVAVLLMDLDHFKYVNDTLGHAIGDLLLREVAARVAARRRARRAIRSRASAATSSRCCCRVMARRRRSASPRRILRALEAPMTLDGHQVDVRASIGIAVAPEHGDGALDADAPRRRRDVRGQAQQPRRRSPGTIATTSTAASACR